LEDWFEHAEAGAQHRHDDDVAAEDPAGRRTERSCDSCDNRGYRAKRLGGQEQADSGGGATECRRWGSDITQLHERVVHQRVLNHVQGHVEILL
jgi:hypothetical protein